MIGRGMIGRPFASVVLLWALGIGPRASAEPFQTGISLKTPVFASSPGIPRLFRAELVALGERPRLALLEARLSGLTPDARNRFFGSLLEMLDGAGYEVLGVQRAQDRL